MTRWWQHVKCHQQPASLGTGCGRLNAKRAAGLGSGSSRSSPRNAKWKDIPVANETTVECECGWSRRTSLPNIALNSHQAAVHGPAFGSDE